MHLIDIAYLDRLTNATTAFSTWSALNVQLSKHSWRPTIRVANHTGRAKRRVERMQALLKRAGWRFHDGHGWTNGR